MSSIHINPANKGKFNATKKKTGKTTEQLTHSSNPVTKKRAIFAQNAAKWHHGEDGLQIPDDWQPGQPIKFNPAMHSSTDAIPLDTKPSKGKPFDLKTIILEGLTALDRILPTQQIKMPVVQPQETYSQHPYGTGSEAMYDAGGYIMDDGGEKGKARKVDTVPAGYKPYPELGANYYHNPQSTQTTGKLMPDAKWNQFMATHPGWKAKQSSDDIVYIDPNTGQPKTSIQTPTANPAFMSRGENIFGVDGNKQTVARGSLYYDLPQSNSSKPVSTDAHFGYYKSGTSNVDPARIYNIPQNVWHNQITNGLSNTIVHDPEAVIGQNVSNAVTYDGGGQVVPAPNFVPLSGYASGGTLSADKARQMLQDNSAHGRPLTKKQKQYFGMVSSGNAANGASITPLSSNPYGSSTFQFNGPSHQEKNNVGTNGIPISYGGNNVEVEGGETGHVDDAGNLIIGGNMQAPGTNKKFKTVFKELADKEQKATKQMGKADKTQAMVIDPTNRIDALTQNSADLLNKGAQMKLKTLADQKQHITLLQQAMLDTAHEHGIDPQEMSKGNIKKLSKTDKAKYGMTIKKYANGGMVKYDNGGTQPWEFRGTNTKRLDPRIVKFAQMVAAKGYTGYSGEKSGYDKRMTTSGHLSRHATGQALDLMFSDSDVYNKILKDPDLTDYLMKNKLTAINEYDPNVAKKTGATTGHIHIGYDQGTPTSDQFRNDAATAYPDKYKPLSTQYQPTKLIPGLLGDAQTEAPVSPYIQKTVNKTFNQNPAPPSSVDNPSGVVTSPFVQSYDKTIPSNKENLDLRQIYPELYAAATNRVQPVNLQQYNPQLKTPYQVSFQDRINENTAGFNAIKPLVNYNPEALSTLAGQLYSANDKDKAEEFRTNQTESNGIYNENINTLNEAQKTNLGLADQQYVRQSEARSKTKSQDESILSSISNKYLQNSLEQKQLQAAESMSGFRFDPTTGQLKWMGNDASFNYGTDNQPTDSNYTKIPYTSTKTTDTYNGNPKVVTTKGEKVVKKASGGVVSLYNQVYGKKR